MELTAVAAVASLAGTPLLVNHQMLYGSEPMEKGVMD